MLKTKIAFYIGLLKHRATIENCVLDNGNPGIGGTQYLFLLTVKYLNELYGDGYAVLLSDEDIDINNEVSIKNVINEDNAIKYCEENNIDFLVFNANIAKKAPKRMFNTDRKIILWAHNTMSMSGQKAAARTKSVYKVVCVSESQYKNMIDSECFPKCTYINNIIPEAFYYDAISTDYSEKKVIYIGSATPQKGIHNLLEIWKYVEKLVPDAELTVIGGARVWNPQSELGCLGVADIYYDKIINARLRKLKYPNNIHFLGAMGWEDIKNKILTSRVGVVNPSHYMRDETFCMSAIEMELHGLPIVSRMRKDGLCTTIINGKNGYMEKNDKEIAKKIAMLLCDKALAEEKGTVAREYSAKFIAKEEVVNWKRIVDNAEENVVCNKKYLPSKDAILLFHDLVLKVIYTIVSGKILEFLKKQRR